MSDISSDSRLTDVTASVSGAPSRESDAIVRHPARAVFGQVMGLVAITVGFSALGAYIGRDLSAWHRDCGVHCRVCMRVWTQLRLCGRA